MVRMEATKEQNNAGGAMSAENGVPTDEKCPKCGTRIVQGKAGYITTDRYECGSIVDEHFVFFQSPTCKRIAELEAKNKKLIALIPEAFEKGYITWGNVEALKDFMQANGLEEG